MMSFKMVGCPDMKYKEKQHIRGKEMKRQRPKNETLRRRLENLKVSPKVDKDTAETIRAELAKMNDEDKPYIHYKDLRVKNLERRKADEHTTAKN